ncbi:MAG: UDP-N-acetylmuramoyl-L-alanyl-D-glutamate--2,6-diaminopimelate ligase, partial [Calditrichaeota bacterium]|nr:UDP-N-acetylmuramoyl-L-alanyl-D-glutamate--2,6-diaminopimelate ligase [Calditrichota bacterium]
MNLTELIENLNYAKTVGDLDREIKQIELNSATIGDQGLFVAIKGLKADGHKYIDSAITSGAVAIVCEEIPTEQNATIAYVQVTNSREALAILAKRFYQGDDDRLVKIAVTGTNGKTSTVYFLRQLFTILGHKCGIIGTIEYDNGK